MGTGYTVDTASLAIRVGELKALADEVEAAANALEVTGGDLGPGDIAAAAREVADQWRDDLGSMRDKIDTIAGNVDGAVANYTAVEQGGADRMRMAVDHAVAEQQLDVLRVAAATQQARADTLLRD
ncbi:MAG: hypothetical protein M3548_12915 [Actinomycetota bacterium]|nr:hypothetical protein [Actinomycetota bacterium]